MGRAVRAAILVVVGALVGMVAGAGAAAADPGTAPAGTFVVDGDVGHPLRLDVADLRARPSRTVTASFVAGAGPETHSWVGVPSSTCWRRPSRCCSTPSATRSYA